MITVVSGKLGSGKSYDCVRRIRLHLANGGCVRTNISLDYRQIGRSVGRRLAPQQIGKVSANDDPKTIPTGDRRGHGTRRTLVVLDEALNWFQSEGAATKDERRREWGEWLRQSDKLGQDVWFIAQNFERAAKWIRELAQVAREAVPLRDLKVLWFVPLWLLFPPIRRCYAVVSWDVRSRQRLSVEVHLYSATVWSLYDTSETFGFVGAASVYDSFSAFPPYRPPLAPLALAWLLLVPAAFAVAISIWF